MSNTQMTIPAQPWNALFTVAPKKELRFYLRGIAVHLTAGAFEAQLVATDGHRLLEWQASLSDAATETRVCILDREHLQKCPAKREVLLTLAGDSTVVMYREPGGVFTTNTVPHIDGTFPAYKRVLADVAFNPLDGDIANRVAFNPQYITDVAKELKADRIDIVTPKKPTDAVAFRFGWDHSGLRSKLQAADWNGRLRYVCMPMRT